MIFLGSSSWAQNLDKMSESERTDALVRIAKEAVLKIGPDFYREYGKPGIEHSYVTDDNRESTEEEAKKYNGRSFYMVISRNTLNMLENNARRIYTAFSSSRMIHSSSQRLKSNVSVILSKLFSSIVKIVYDYSYSFQDFRLPLFYIS